MRIIEMLYMVWVNIIQNKVKVLLTSLGIIVGATTIVLVIAIGVGGEEEVRKNFNGLSAETIYVNVNYARLQNKDLSSIEKLNMKHLQQIKEENRYLVEAYLRAGYYEEVNAGSKKEYIAVNGVTSGYAKVSNLNVVEGEDMTIEDLEQGANVAVIGDGIAKKLFSAPSMAVGKKIRIKNDTYRILGVLERKGDGIQGLQADDSIFIPYLSGEKRYANQSTIPQITALAVGIKEIPDAIRQLKSTLHYLLEDSENYIIEDAGSRIEAASKSQTTMKFLLIAVASIVFLVGGIGIMNVLFISVQERTREIGILKALGMKKHEILLQFLLESIGISCFGGIIGVFVGQILLPFMQYTQIPVKETLTGPILAFLFSVITGSVFGWYPAYKASNLRPIEALNFE